MRHNLCAMKMEYSDQESCHDILKSEKNNWNRVCLVKLNQRARYATESRYIAHDHETFIFGQTVDQCSQGIIWLKCMPTIPIHTELKNTQIEYYFRRFFFYVPKKTEALCSHAFLSHPIFNTIDVRFSWAKYVFHFQQLQFGASDQPINEIPRSIIITIKIIEITNLIVIIIGNNCM